MASQQLDLFSGAPKPPKNVWVEPEASETGEGKETQENPESAVPEPEAGKARSAITVVMPSEDEQAPVIPVGANKEPAAEVPAQEEDTHQEPIVENGDDQVNPESQLVPEVEIEADESENHPASLAYVVDEETTEDMEMEAGTEKGAPQEIGIENRPASIADPVEFSERPGDKVENSAEEQAEKEEEENAVEDEKENAETEDEEEGEREPALLTDEQEDEKAEKDENGGLTAQTGHSGEEIAVSEDRTGQVETAGSEAIKDRKEETTIIFDQHGEAGVTAEAEIQQKEMEPVENSPSQVRGTGMPPDDQLFSKQYYTMAETTDMLGISHSMVRFWENEFPILKPRKNRKGDRYFRPEDIKNLELIFHLLKVRRFTIEGAREYMKSNKGGLEQLDLIKKLEGLRSFLNELKTQI